MGKLTRWPVSAVFVTGKLAFEGVKEQQTEKGQGIKEQRGMFVKDPEIFSF